MTRQRHHGVMAGGATLAAPFVTFGLILLVLFFIFAPWQAFRALRSAARAGDERGVSSLMDVEAVRAGLRADRGYKPGPLGLPGLEAPPPNVEGLMSPRAINFFSHAGPHQPGDPFRAGNLFPGLHDSRIAYWGPNRAQIAALAAGGKGRENLFTFERRGLFKWRLTAIHAD